MDPALGFACQWGDDRRRTWSGTPWRLREALALRTRVVDLDVTLPFRFRRALRLAYARRYDRHWQSMWGHGRPALAVGERLLQRAAARTRPDVVVEIQDLGILDTPFYVLQDLSYDLLIERFGERGVPHFRSLSRTQILRLRERQYRIYDAASGLLPMSRWLGDQMASAGVAPARVHVVNPGINAPLDPAAPIPARRQSPTRRLLFVGRDFETKAGDQVVAAFCLLRADLGPGIELTIAGPKAWPLRGVPPDGVRFLGPVPAARVQDLYDSHDLFVMPSRFEGFGIAFVEALVRGLPCVGRRACAMPEIIDERTGGRLVTHEDPHELAEAVLDALGDDELYAACAAQAPARRAHYTWQRAADEVLRAVAPYLPDQ